MLIGAGFGKIGAQAPARAPRYLARLGPLGIPLTVEADSLRLIAAVSSSCTGWEPGREGPRPLRLDLEIGSVRDAPDEISVVGSILSVRGGVDGWADATAGRAWCRVPAADSFDDPAFRERVLDSLILWLATHRDRAPVHASAFTAGDMAILLAGRSGSGKSCLARAADEAGFPLMTDDTVYVETAERFRVWSIPRPIHLYPEDAPDRPDDPVRLRNGKRKRAIERRQSHHVSTADSATLCVLSRGDAVALDPIDGPAALSLLGPHEAGFDLLGAAIDKVLHRITRHGAWRLTLGRDPDEAIRLLAANLPRLRERAAS